MADCTLNHWLLFATWLAATVHHNWRYAKARKRISELETELFMLRMRGSKLGSEIV